MHWLYKYFEFYDCIDIWYLLTSHSLESTYTYVRMHITLI